MPNAEAVRDVDAETLKRWLEGGQAVLVDVRGPAMHAAERIPGATLVPFARLAPDALPPADGKRLVVHCEIGVMSQRAARKLAASGLPQVYNLRGGIAGWKRSGFAVEGDPGAPLPLPRQVQLIAGSLVLLGTLLGAALSPWFLLLSGALGAGLVCTGATGWCAMTGLLLKLPYNRRAYPS